MSSPMTNQPYYIIEKSGERRQMWGPYDSLAAANKACGVRHVVIAGSGLHDADIMSRGELNAALKSGRIWTADGSSADALA